jgi:hypothetical protein
MSSASRAVESEDRGIGGGWGPLHKCIERGATARSEVGRGLQRDQRAHRQHRCPIEQMLRMKFCGGTR